MQKKIHIYILQNEVEKTNTVFCLKPGAKPYASPGTGLLQQALCSWLLEKQD